MMHNRAPLVALAVAAALPLPARPDAAAETRLREALRSAQMQLRTVEDERAKWQETEAQLRRELEAAKREAGEAPKKGGAAERALAHLRRQAAEQATAAATLKASLATCEAASRDAADAARFAEADRGRLRGQVASLEARLAASERKNARMFQIGKEIIDWVENIGARVQSEPVLGLERVKLENIAQDYGDKLLEQKVGP